MGLIKLPVVFINSTVLQHHIIAVTLSVLILIIDISFPLISAESTAYIFVLYVVSRLKTKSLIWGYASICTLLALLPAVNYAGPDYLVSADRLIAIPAIWFVAWILHSLVRRTFNVSPLSQNGATDDLLRLTFDSAPNALVMVDAEGVIRLANKAMLSLFGYRLRELLGKKIEVLIPQRYGSHHVELRNQYLQEPAKRNMGEGRDLFGIHKDGTEIPVEIGLNPVNTRSGLMIISSIVDISERVSQMDNLKNLSRKLALTNKYLEKTNQELDDFAYVASHDLKAPLRGIEHLASFIEEDAGELLPQSSREDLTLLRDRIKRMENLLSSLLAYSRIGRKEGEPTWVDTRAVIDDVLELYLPSERFQVVLPEQLPKVFAPLAAVELVFRNLIMNAVKHHDQDEGVIHIEVKNTGKEQVFIISDDGPGIPEEYQEKVFQLFQTLKPRDELEGSGMGLALVRKTMEIHEGHVEVTSDGKRGTSFSVAWPIPQETGG